MNAAALTTLLLILAAPGARASGFAADWNGDPLKGVSEALAAMPPVKLPEPALECRPEVIAAFKKAWAMGGSGLEDYEAGFRIDRDGDGYDVVFATMTHQSLKLPMTYDRVRTAAIAHTHPDSAEPTPGPNDYEPSVPNFVISRYALYVTIPGTRRERFVRRDWAAPCR